MSKSLQLGYSMSGYLEGNITLISNGHTYVSYADKKLKKNNGRSRNRIQGKFIYSKLTISPHPNFYALLESAVLTLCSVLTIDAAVSRGFTSVRQLIANRSVEEAFAPLAREDSIVSAWWRRVTNSAIDGLFWVIVPINLVKLRPGHAFFLGLRTISLSARPLRITHPDFGGQLCVT